MLYSAHGDDGGQEQIYFLDVCVGLIYLDPPFNSNRSYNVLEEAEHGAQAPSQISASNPP